MDTEGGPRNCTRSSRQCPECGSFKIWKAGVRNSQDGPVQRWLCRECGFRFTERKNIYAPSSRDLLRQTSVQQDRIGRLGLQKNRGMQTMKTSRSSHPPLYLATKPAPAGNKGKIVDYSFWLLKQGYAESTIRSRTKLLKILAKRGADLFDPESVKETIARQKWSNGRKGNAVDAYSCFLKMAGMTWEPPRYNRIRKLPFIPTETEIDQLIAGCGKKTATLLQLLKETGMRIGEAWKLQWTDIDSVNNTIRVTPEKGSNPRIFKASSKLTAMLNAVRKKRKSNRIFGKWLKSQERLFYNQRKNIARKLQNPRIFRITFHTFRHWKATMEYHKTRDILHVMRVLGHKNIKNTLVYTQLVDLHDDEYVSKVAETVQEACQLVEAGFEYVTEINDVKIFRKRK